MEQFIVDTLKSLEHLTKLEKEGYNFSVEGFAWKGNHSVKLYEPTRQAAHEIWNSELRKPEWRTPSIAAMQSLQH